ncbi:hypothetical protein [Deinococcus multiflagellatus]|uniref:hypothetical protein n=1 Tax=Deinococcus multiflagellatus TaxID=1656887 RepID=UPI001CCF2C47|nr:hypothetical protein [Deinococcus multiflagellatus]MBZ9714438.1 hypothetical protein [Deinococcus multiflagellatus]
MTATTPTAVDAPPRSGRIFDTGRLEALEPELQKYNVEVPSSPDDPAFETVLAQLGASHPDLARQLAAAVTDELGDQARAKFQQAATRGDRKNLLARKASSAVKTTNHKGRPQFNPLAFKIIGGVVFLGVIAGILLAPVPETDTAKEATTANLGEPPLPPDGTETGNQPGNAEGGTSPTTPGNGGTPTPAESITPAPSPPGSTGLAVDANGRPLSSGASSGAPTSPTSLNTTETPLPPVPTDADLSPEPTSAPEAFIAAPTPLPVSARPVQVDRTPQPTAADLAVLQALTGQPATGQRAPTATEGQPVRVEPRTPPTLLTVATPAPAAAPPAPAAGAAGGLKAVSTPAPAPAARAAPTLVSQAAPAQAAAPAPTRGTLVQVAGAAPPPAAPRSAAALAVVSGGAPASTRGGSGLGHVTAPPAPESAAATSSGVRGMSAAAGVTAQAAATTPAPSAPASPYRMGDVVSGTLMTGLALTPQSGSGNGAGQIVYVQGEDGSRWRGTATLLAPGRVAITFDRVLKGDVVYPVQGDAVGTDAARLPGLPANTRRESPAAAAQLLQAVAAGLKTFAEQSARGSTTVTAGTVVTSSPKPNFWVTVGGAVAGALTPAAPTVTTIEITVVDAGAPVAIAVRGQ